MSGDTFMEPKQGRSTGSKIFLVLLILGGGMLILCCGGGVFMWQGSQAEESEEAAVASTKQIVDINVPDYFKGDVGVNLNLIFMKMKMAVYQLREGIPIEVSVADDEKKIDDENIKKKKVEKEKKKPTAKKKKDVPKVKKEKANKKKQKDDNQETKKKKEAAKFRKTVTKKSDGALVLIWFNMWGMGGGTDAEREEMRKQMRIQMAQNSNIDSAMDIDSTERVPVKVAGTMMDIKIRKGRHSRSNRRIRSVEVVFPGKDNGMVFVFLLIPESLYKKDEIIKMLENINIK